MPDIIIVILAVIFVLGVAINIHEFGHFIVAKIFGMRVEAYSFFGLGPRIWGFKIGHTDYRISAIPLGAYVKLYGDEATASLEGGSSDDEKVPDSELYELRPRWQKFLVMLGGPFMNIVLALAIPFGGALMNGIPAMPAPVVGMVNVNGAAEKAGIKPGDRIVAFDGVENPTFDRLRKDAAILADRATPIVVERDGKRLPLTITPTRVSINGNGIGELDFVPDIGAEPVVVAQVVADKPAALAGLQKGDLITAVNDKVVRNQLEVRNTIRDSKGAPVRLSVSRNNEQKEFTIAAQEVGEGTWQIGVGFDNKLDDVRDPATVSTAAAFAVNSNLDMLRLTGRVFGQIFAGERSVRDAGLAGPVGIVQLIAQVVRDAGFAGLVAILALISLNLGVFNLLPIPLLDGGQIMVLGIEKVMSWFGKTMSMAFRERIQIAGLAIIALLMLFTMVLDISRFF